MEVDSKNENRPAPMGSPVPPVRVIPPEESLQAAILGLRSVESSDPDVTRIGKSVVIKGDISASPEVGASIWTANLKVMSSSTVASLSGLRDVSAPTCKLVASRCKTE